MTEVGYQPQYRRIEQAMRQRIASLQPGERLPSDAELQAEFGVSRMTARNAMQRLTDEGLIAREPGRGSFVASSTAAHRRANRLMTFSHEMRRRGLTPSSRILTRVIRPSTRAEADALDLRPTEPIVHLRRLRLADGEPIAIEETLLLAPCAPAMMTADLTHGSLHEALAAGGWRLQRGSGSIAAEAATPDDARLLRLRPGDPLLVERRVIATDAGQRLEATESRYAAGRYGIDVEFEVEDPDTTEPIHVGT
ncbi:MAG TPA: GntR family transcriptional regulator [Candidatus Saccharimonadales bacterium]|nr:GntR family transcriptional regulator [Candidatus Saccharimonadales bacterium]